MFRRWRAVREAKRRRDFRLADLREFMNSMGVNRHGSPKYFEALTNTYKKNRKDIWDEYWESVERGGKKIKKGERT